MSTESEVEVAAETVTVRFWASARAAAGEAERVVPVPGPITVAALVSLLQGTADTKLAKVLGVCSVLVGDQPVAPSARAESLIAPGAVVEFLPPFAGG